MRRSGVVDRSDRFPATGTTRGYFNRCFGITWLMLLIIFGITLATLICVALMKPKLNSIRDSLVTITTITSTTVLELDTDCDDSNNCTLDYSVGGTGCVNYNVMNGVSCEDACFNSTTSICTAGQCTGTCIGLCEEPNDCLNITFISSVNEMDTAKECIQETCQTRILNVNTFNGFDQTDLANCTNFQGYLSQRCLDFVNDTETVKDCLNADYCPEADGGTCVFTFACASYTIT